MLEQLTWKEQKIVNLLMQGITPKKIANKLCTSHEIIHLHLFHVRKKIFCTYHNRNYPMCWRDNGLSKDAYKAYP